MALKIIEAEKEISSQENNYEVCDLTKAEDNREQCKQVIDQHARQEISTKEAQEKISSLLGQEIKLVEEPEWKMLTTDKDTLESWATSACMSYTEDESKIDSCVYEVDRLVKGQQDISQASEKLGKLLRADPLDIEKTLIITSPDALKS